MANIVMVANDVAPSEAFRRLSEILPATTFLNFGKKEPLDMVAVVAAVQAADFVLIGMSNPPENTKIETAAAWAAVGAGTRFGFYSDTFGAYNRASFAPFREQASLVLVIAPGRDVERAGKVFPNARVVCTYNPLWPDYFLPASREEARKLVGAEDKELVILAAGENYAVTMIDFCVEVIEASSKVASSDSPVRVVIAPHPGEKRITSDMYDQLLSFNEEFGVNVMMIPEGVKSDQLVPGASVIVQRFNSSVGIHGICRRIPVIDLYRPMAQKILKRISGDEEGYFIETDAVAHVYPDGKFTGFDSLGDALYCIKHNSVFGAEMIGAQQAAIPHLEPGVPTANMKKAIEEVLAR